MDDKLKRQMDEGAMPAAHEHPGLPRHGGMHGGLGEAGAIDIVLRIRGHAAHDVAGVDVFDVHLVLAGFEEGTDAIL